MKRLVVVRANGAALPVAKVAQVQAGDVIVVPSDFMVRQLGQAPSVFQRIMQTMAAVATAFIVK